MADYLTIDCETHNAGLEYSMPAREFYRLGQFSWNDGPVVLTTRYDEFVDVVRSADYVVGHNIIGYDLSWLFGTDSMEPLQMALDHKVIDTFVIGSLITPAPYSYTNKDGHTFFDAAKPEQAMKWLSLANLTHQFGLPGKIGSLQDLAKKYNPKGTLIKNLDYSLIPLDDPEFLEYAEGDIIAGRALWNYQRAQIKAQGYSGEYIWNELINWSINAQISRNGWLVDKELAQSRVDELEVNKNRIMAELVEKHEFPTDGKAPWSSTKGKEVIMDVLALHGITPKTRPEWPRTPTGAPKLGGEDLLTLTEGTGAQEFGSAMATLKGQRSLAQLALDSMHPDGRVHPDITCLQRSGRASIQRPGLTVWSAKGDKAVEKAYFIADPGTKLVEMDYSSADARAVAALSGDPEFAKRFEPGVDSHDLTGVIFFGADHYYANREELRPLAKMGGLAMAYRIGSKKLAANLGVSQDVAAGFIAAYKKAYPWVALWQDEITKEGDQGYVTNAWGRRMAIDEGRSFTQSSALAGQSTTKEVLYQGLRRIAFERIEVIGWIKATVHDAVIFSVPVEELETVLPWISERMVTVFNPKTKVSQPITFSMSVGPPADDWQKAAH